MGSRIVWRVLDEGVELDIGARSSFIEAMTKAFGQSPWYVGRSKRERIQGMADAGLDGAEQLLAVMLVDGSEIEVRVVF